MYCKHCGSPTNDAQDYCLNCGVKTGGGNSFCSNCGQSLPPDAAVCINCGVSVNQFSYKLAEHNKYVMALVCFLAGGIGIHNFIMGETRKGIFKIVMSFCCGISTILALIDLVRILIDQYEINPNKIF